MPDNEIDERRSWFEKLVRWARLWGILIAALAAIVTGLVGIWNNKEKFYVMIKEIVVLITKSTSEADKQPHDKPANAEPKNSVEPSKKNESSIKPDEKSVTPKNDQLNPKGKPSPSPSAISKTTKTDVRSADRSSEVTPMAPRSKPLSQTSGYRSDRSAEGDSFFSDKDLDKLKNIQFGASYLIANRYLVYVESQGQNDLISIFRDLTCNIHITDNLLAGGGYGIHKRMNPRDSFDVTFFGMKYVFLLTQISPPSNIEGRVCRFDIMRKY